MSGLDTELVRHEVDGLTRNTRVAIIGAGLAGLTVAYRLANLEGAALQPIVLEAGERCGGFLETIERDGFTIDRGADSMITDKPWGLSLCHELGLDDAILPTNAAYRRSFIARGSRLHAVPEGFHLMAPSRLLPFAFSSLLSWRGKLRVALEPFVAARADADADESLAAFVRRRLGAETLERIAQPMVGGIYTADPERLSLRATMPRFAEMERAHGSIVRALIAARRNAGDAGPPAGPNERDDARRYRGVGEASGPRYQLFVSLRQGMEQLARTLATKLPPGTIHFGRRVSAIQPSGSGWRVTTTNGPLEVDALCLAVPSYVAGSLLEPFLSEAARELAAIEHASTATVALAYRRQDIGHPLDGFGFVVPAIERRIVIGCTFSSVKFPGRAPKDMVLLRGFVGGALAPRNFELDDAAMTVAVETDLRELLAIGRPPLWSLVTRFARSMPQYHVGHIERVAAIDRAVAAFPTLALAGNAYIGAGIPDTIHSAERAAERLGAALAVTRAAGCRA